MNLEIIQRLSMGESRGAPVLLVHGVCHAAWCWEYWLDWFAARGRDVSALSLRGHGGSEGREKLHEFGLQDYRDDVLATARAMDKPPILIGHSMGGAVSQLAMAADPSAFAGVVLLASLPQDSMKLWELLPLMFHLKSVRATRKLMAGQPITAREAQCLSFFDNRLTAQQADRYAALLQPESKRAQIDLIRFRAPPPPAAGPQVLVLGSARDALFGRGALERTARYYGADLEVMDAGCHDLMVDPLWEDAVARVDRWAAAKGL